MALSIYEIAFTYTPIDEHDSGSGLTAVLATSAKQAREILQTLMPEDNLCIASVTEIADVSDSIILPAHLTLQ